MTRRGVYRIGQAVTVNTGGKDAKGVICQVLYAPLKGSICVAFNNGTSQWIPVQYVREEEVTA